MRIAHRLPVDSAGYGDVSYLFQGRDIVIEFQYFSSGMDRIGRLRIEYFMDIFIESETQNGAKIPQASGVIFETEARKEGFRKFVVWFSNNDIVTFECMKLFCDNLEL
ncbi:hypothetical protein [Taklimakanibacter lacteus]|uniref:hypothetical protein n=1 Tax=Taklimakanibacter lacteus TaxID=2268456 RepID=UPI000E66A345